MSVLRNCSMATEMTGGALWDTRPTSSSAWRIFLMRICVKAMLSLLFATFLNHECIKRHHIHGAESPTNHQQWPIQSAVWERKGELGANRRESVLLSSRHTNRDSESDTGCRNKNWKPDFRLPRRTYTRLAERVGLAGCRSRTK